MKPITLSIKTDPKFKDIKWEPIVAEIRQLGDQLLVDLEFPCKVNVALEDIPDTELNFQLWVEDNVCNLHAFNSPSEQTGDLEHYMHRALGMNPGIYLTQAVANHFWQLLNESRADCPPRVYYLLQKVLQYRIKPSRLPALSDNPSEKELNEAFERAFSSTSRSIEFQLNPDRYEEIAENFTKSTPGEGGKSSSMIQMMIEGLFYELGVTVGDCIPTPDPGVSYDQFRLKINDAHTLCTKLPQNNELLVNDTVDRLSLLNIHGKEAVNPANGSECAFVPSDNKEVVEQAGLTTWDTAGYAVLYASSLIRSLSHTLLTLEAMDLTVDKLAQAFPFLTERIRSCIGIPKLTRIFRYYLENELSIRNLRLLLETLLLMPPEADVDQNRLIVFTPNMMFRPLLPINEPESVLEEIGYSETLRMSNREYISHKYTRGGNTLVVYLLDRSIEQRLASGAEYSFDELFALLNAINCEIGTLQPAAQNPVILTTSTLRYRVRKIIEREFPYIAVLSYNDLSPTLNIQPIARIALE